MTDPIREGASRRRLMWTRNRERLFIRTSPQRLRETKGIQLATGCISKQLQPMRGTRNVRHTVDTDPRPPRAQNRKGGRRRSALRSKRGPAAKTPKRETSGTVGIRPGIPEMGTTRRRQRVLKGNKPHERRPTAPVERATRRDSRARSAENVRSGRCHEVRPQCPPPPIASERPGRSRAIGAETQDNSPRTSEPTRESG
jgi:hypothetical protein